jgi:hypothetical protein
VNRVLAIIAAVAMVTVAVIVRDSIDDDDGGGDDGRPDGELVIVCASDIAGVCPELGDSVEVRVEDPTVTAATIADGTIADDVDGWITSTAWLEVVESRARGATGEAHAIARTPVVMATAPGRLEAIADLCEGQDVWACLGGAAGEDWADLGDGSNAQWRELKVGLTDPSSATGLPVLASAASGFFGTTEFAANDPRFGEFETWLANLARPSAEGDVDPARTLATRPGTYSAAGALAAIVEQFAGRGVSSIEPAEPLAATVAVVELPRSDGLPDTDALRDQLRQQGWSAATEDDLAPTLKPGVMAALHTLWRAVTS